MAKQNEETRKYLREIMNSVGDLNRSQKASLTANVNVGLTIPQAIQNSVDKGKLDREKAEQLEKEYADLMADVEGATSSSSRSGQKLKPHKKLAEAANNHQ